ncbi:MULTISPECIES: alpha/beta hydrolase [unclassified Gemella]|uniref:alpha/beta hydrolase n=1 Tax=unclassified Gemella TaxID=2624949 RepID=UPI001C54F228|nr:MULTISPECIES: alpha/beta hydrolase [unclassified Gemella]
MKFIKKFKKSIISFFIIILLAASWFVGDYFHNFALNPQISKDGVTGQDNDGVEDTRKVENQKWFNEKAIEQDMKSVTGVNLKGYTFTHNNEKNEKWIIVTHGFTSSAKDAVKFIKGFYNRGYNVFAPDLIAHGNSEGKTYSMGGHDSSDLVNWVKKISAENNNPDIVLFGVSMGAAATMNSLNKGLPENVKGFIEDSGYVSLDEEFSYQLKKLFKLPSFPVIPLANFVTGLKASYNFGDVDAKEALKSTKLPALILHGGQDGFVPVDNADIAYNLLNSYKEKYIFDDAKHVKAERKYNEEYWQHIERFLVKAYSGNMTATTNFKNNLSNGDEEFGEDLESQTNSKQERGTELVLKHDNEENTSNRESFVDSFDYTSDLESSSNFKNIKSTLPSTRAVTKSS